MSVWGISSLKSGQHDEKRSSVSMPAKKGVPESGTKAAMAMASLLPHMSVIV